MRADDLIGQSIAGYTIEAILGRGSLTVVYRANEGKTGQAVALKRLLAGPDMHEAQMRFGREARLAKALDHPAIVPILDVGQVDGHTFLVMPLVEGGSLADRLRAAGRFDEVFVADLAWQVADALHYAHSQGIVHRDVKPSNILLAANGRALLADFGVARAFDDPKLTQTGLAVGTPYYMAPEQAAGERQIDGRADLYGLGVVLYQLVTGRIPFQGSTPQVLHAHVYQPPPAPSSLATVSPQMETLILRALAKEPAHRFQTGADMAQAVAHLEEDLAAEKTQTRLDGPASSRRWPVWLAGLMMALIIAGGGWWISQGQPVEQAIPSPDGVQVAAISTATVKASSQRPPPTKTQVPTPSVTSTATQTPNLPFPPGTLLKGSGDGVFRLAADGQLQHVFDWETFLAFGFEESEITTVDDSVLAQWPAFEALRREIRDGEGRNYWVVDGGRWSVDRWQDALESLDPTLVDADLLADLSLTLDEADLPSGTLLTTDNQTYYLMVGPGMLRRVDSARLVDYGYEPADTVLVPDPILFNAGYQVGPALGPLIRPEGSEQVFRLERGQRRAMPGGDDLWALGYGVDDISDVPAGFADRYPLIAEAEAPPTATAIQACQQAPAAFVAGAWQADPALAQRLGCPQETQLTGVAWQPFEGGHMLWRQDLSLIYVLFDDGGWRVTGDRWREGDADFDPAIIAPDGRYQPVRGFGVVWREDEGVRLALSWGLDEEMGFQGQIQQFDNGFAIGSTDGADLSPIFFLLNDGAYETLSSG